MPFWVVFSGIIEMSYEAVESRFEATPEKGLVSSLLLRPEGARWLLVLGHGASTNMRHRTLQCAAPQKLVQ